MTNSSKKVTTKEKLFCNYKVSSFSKLHDVRIKKTGSPFQYLLETNIHINQYIRTAKILCMQFRRNQFFMPDALPRQKLT